MSPFLRVRGERLTLGISDSARLKILFPCLSNLESHVDLDDIRIFLAVAREGSLAGASERLGTTQPTLSKAVARLERENKVKLFERLPRGMRLTDVGDAFLRYAERLDLEATDLYAALRDLRQARAGVLRLGVGQGVPDRLVTAMAGQMIGTGVDLDIAGGMTDSLQRAVAIGELEFAVIGLMQAASPGLTWTPLRDDPMQPIAPADHPLASTDQPVAWSVLAAAKWIVPGSGTASFDEFQRNFHDRGLPAPRPCVASRTSHRELPIAAAIGAIVLVPRSLAEEAGRVLNFVSVRPEGGWSSSRELGIVRRQAGYISAAAQKAIDCIREAAGR